MTTFDCKDIKAILSGLVDGEVDDETRHNAERHLADCSPCRNLLDEAESLNAVLAMDGERTLWNQSLPASFEQSVLRQTVYAEAYHYAGRRWTSWLGWVAAAACLGLAVSLWFVNRQLAPVSGTGLIAQNQPENSNSQIARANPYDVRGMSWTYDGGLPTKPSPEDAYLTVDDQLTRVLPVRYATQDPILSITLEQTLSSDDAQTLYNAANLLDMLAHVDVNSFAGIERIRQIAEYDELVERLADVRTRVTGMDRAIVLAAESLLVRIVNGPISMDDLKALHDTARSLEMAEQLDAISNGSRDTSI